MLFEDPLAHDAPTAAVKHTAKLFSDGFRPILLFWLLTLSMIVGLSLLIIGVAQWNGWVFLAGLLLLRLFAFLCVVGEQIMHELSKQK